MLEVLGFIAALFIGLSLGLMGGGGSIVTVPVLVYLMHYSPVVATGYSLFVVGSASAVGAAIYKKRNLVDLKTAIAFGVPAAIAVYLTRQFLVPAIPEEIFNAGNFTFTKNVFIMLLFATIMIFAALSMIRDRHSQNENLESKNHKSNLKMLLFQGLGIGLLTGLVGVGGGFMIVPALVVFSNLKMKMAVGTSLLIIAVNSLVGFMGDVLTRNIDWSFLLIFTAIAIVGIIIGNRLSKKVSEEKIKLSFGWFVLVMGVYILVKETLL